MSLWDEDRVNRYLKRYGDPRDQRGSQSILCRDAAQLIEGTSVLDVGCGMGHLIPYMEGFKYAGLDFSQDMLEALHKRFPLIVTHHLDATKPFPVTLGSSDTVISISMFIHLPTIEDVIAALKNMWSEYVCNKAMIFGVETLGDGTFQRKDGLTLRNMKVDTVVGILKEELGIRDKKISWVHQKYTYQQTITVVPSKDNSVAMSTALVQRTTLFKVMK